GMGAIAGGRTRGGSASERINGEPGPQGRPPPGLIARGAAKSAKSEPYNEPSRILTTGEPVTTEVRTGPPAAPTMTQMTIGTRSGERMIYLQNCELVA